MAKGNPKAVVDQGNNAVPRDSSKQGRMDAGGSTPAVGSDKERVSSQLIPEKRGVREPDQNFPAPASVDQNRGPKEP